MTLQEIQYKAQGIIHKWRDDDSAPYIEFVEELAHMIVPEPSEDLEEAAKEYFKPEWSGSIIDAFIAEAKWQAEQFLKSSPLPEDTVLFNKGVEEGKRLMMEEAVEGVLVDNIDGTKDICLHENRFGDKVRIIIVKE